MNTDSPLDSRKASAAADHRALYAADGPSLVARDLVVRSERTPAGDYARILPWFARVVVDTTSAEAVALLFYRPTWDDFEVVAVESADRALREALISLTDPREAWHALLLPPSARRSAHRLPREAVSTLAFGRAIEASRLDGEIVAVPVVGRHDVVVGLLAAVLPSGVSHGPGEASLLVDVAECVGIVTSFGQTGVNEQDRAAMLEDLLLAEVHLSEELPIKLMLELWCSTVQRVTAFQNVFVVVYGTASGPPALRHRHAVGWRPADDPAYAALEEPRQLGRLLDRRFMVEGCAIVPIDDVRAVLPGIEGGGFFNATGPSAWNDHWLLVPLHGAAGELIGVARLDEPVDMLLPSSEKLRALRLFANHLGQTVTLRGVRQQLTRAAIIDPLTRLPNRRSFSSRLAAEVARAVRHGRECALVVVDLDRLKAINDTRGHEAGDEALVTLARVLSAHVRAGDLVFRTGGDEFALLLPESSCREAKAAVSRVREALARVAEPLTASFGVAIVPTDGTDVVGLMRAADRAMYGDKPSHRQP